MQHYTRQDTDDHGAPSTDLLPVRATQPAGLVLSPDEWNPAPTGPYAPHGTAYGPLAPQHGYLGTVLPPHVLQQLLGEPEPPLPRVFQRTNHFFSIIGRAHLLPGLGVLTMAGLSAWAHSEPYHPLIGGSLIAVGAWLVRSGIAAHRHHGADADAAFTKGAAAAGAACVIIGTGVTAGLSGWTALAFGAATWLAYGAAAALRHRHRQEAREFAVALVAAGNTGPALASMPPMPPGTWTGPVSDEEYRLRKAFTAIKGEQVIVGAVRRVNDDVWYVFADVSETGLTLEQIEKQTGKIATAMGARRVEIEPADRSRASAIKITVYDGDDLLEETIPWDGRTVTSVLEPIPLGIFEDGSEITLSLAWKHTLVCGTTDMGKSGVLNEILCATMPCQDLVRILTDCKAGAPEFRPYKDVAFTVATSPEEGMRVLAGLEAIYRYRGALLVEKDVAPEFDEEVGETVQKWRSEFGPFILASIDELAELTSKVKGAAERIQSLRGTMRFVGMFALDATQTPGRDVFGGTTTARLNYLNRISLATAEQGATNIIFGQGMHGRGWRPDMLDLPGLMYVYSPTNKRPRKARAYRVDAQAVAQTVSQWRGRVPKLDQGSADVFWDAYEAEPVPETSGGDGGPHGGRRPEPADAAPFGRPRLVVVPTYPDGTQIDEKDQALWQLLGSYGAAGATAKELAATAEAQGHAYKSPAWIRGRLEYWRAKEYVAFEQDGRETRHWRMDLTVDQRKDA